MRRPPSEASSCSKTITLGNILNRREIKHMNKITIFCLPYAGGTKTIYSEWIKKYKSLAEVIPLEYSGHGSRFCEPLYKDADEIANDIFDIIIKKKPENYMIFGHSMGSLISLLVADRLEKKYSYPPKLVVVGGTRPPHLKDKDEKYTDLPKAEIMEKIFNMGQTDDDIMNDKEFVELLYDIFYADLCVNEKYSAKGNIKLKTPMMAMTGIQDKEAPIEDMKEWGMYTESEFKLQIFEDNHFFPFTCCDFHESFTKVISEVIGNRLVKIR
ncbi:hypothetical protein CUC43_17875 [Bacillus thuringiensis LM1212]|nr:hypothetical protein CUC43_17875 [Bacillus thuringiensis LM1212]